ncbi:hypothetical protein LTR56_008266 [Elasticomyces elasticus]|nr:hypothetical protein LTR56_008266 [Elasticomyces elasticus]KAK3661829.1 hypothetical protein LTR22_007412 [Elasticomyces elasticus]KAK4924433.1 hypothetical protein LTR49_008524 [Elasticomyces elasticus]KAK5762602.1 hypothetical protein LTS12_007192 [Elasticomyces elasticus]
MPELVTSHKDESATCLEAVNGAKTMELKAILAFVLLVAFSTAQPVKSEAEKFDPFEFEWDCGNPRSTHTSRFCH